LAGGSFFGAVYEISVLMVFCDAPDNFAQALRRVQRRRQVT
jgi:hypothetical protein